MGAPKRLETLVGDGAAVVTVGSRDLQGIEASFSIHRDFTDVWRTEAMRF
jgi:3-hydroxy-3-methylglutaryl CoA synthase